MTRIKNVKNVFYIYAPYLPLRQKCVSGWVLNLARKTDSDSWHIRLCGGEKCDFRPELAPRSRRFTAIYNKLINSR